MKNLILILALLSSLTSMAQNVNWHSIQEDQKSLAFLNFGYDYGITSQIGYAYKLNAFKPIILKGDFSIPMGENLLDDYKVRLGAQVLVFEKKNFLATAKVHGMFRRQQTNLVRMANFSSELSILLGYYKAKWHLACEIGIDKSNRTNLKHSESYRANYPEIKDGWYAKSGGNFFYGIQGSKTLGKRLELSVRVGSTNALSDHSDALIPKYFQIGLLQKF